MNNFFKSAISRLFGRNPEAPIKQGNVETGVPTKVSPVEIETPVTLTIWTIERNRFSASRALCTDIEVMSSEVVNLHEDIQGYVLNTPSGDSVVVEARTGSLVGHSLEVVRDGVREMSKQQLNAQLDTARKEFNRMSKVELSNADFWKEIRMGGSELEIAQDYLE